MAFRQTDGLCGGFRVTGAVFILVATCVMCIQLCTVRGGHGHTPQPNWVLVTASPPRHETSKPSPPLLSTFLQPSILAVSNSLVSSARWPPTSTPRRRGTSPSPGCTTSACARGFSAGCSPSASRSRSGRGPPAHAQPRRPRPRALRRPRAGTPRRRGRGGPGAARGVERRRRRLGRPPRRAPRERQGMSPRLCLSPRFPSYTCECDPITSPVFVSSSIGESLCLCWGRNSPYFEIFFYAGWPVPSSEFFLW